MNIKSIETQYKGYRFRSRLEARWAVFFDALGLKWEYEKEGFEFDDGTRYLPDFWLPQLGVWVEIKGEKPDEKIQKLMSNFRNRSNAICLFWGLPGENPGEIYCFDLSDSGGGAFDFECIFYLRQRAFYRTERSLELSLLLLDRRVRNYYSDWDFENRLDVKNLNDLVPSFETQGWSIEIKIEPNLIDEFACQKARAARFEFGEGG
jgi:hypothetical protein